jgi:rhomboid family GlyGly-CTERM serine protease
MTSANGVIRNPSAADRGSFPFVTLILAALALWLHSVGAETWQYTRTGLAHAEVWRLWTGHFAHWDASQLAWDIAMFIVLGTIVERRDRGALLAIVLLGAAVIAVTLWFQRPDLHTYRGLSGLDTALFATAATGVLLAPGSRVRSATRAIAAIALGLVFAKCAYEMTAARSLFASAVDWSVVPLAHFTGWAVGVLAGVARALLMTRRRRAETNEGAALAAPPLPLSHFSLCLGASVVAFPKGMPRTGTPGTDRCQRSRSSCRH